MALQSVWYFTNLPKDIIDIVERDLSETFDSQMGESTLYGGVVNKEQRDSQNAWIPTCHWICGFLWHYVQLANRENFLFDITHIDNQAVQYTRYGEGQYYKWHNDANLSSSYRPIGDAENLVNDFVTVQSETIRKLSFVLQLSDVDDYEGGNLQIMDERGSSYIAPRQRGTMILFDSRSQHRVTKVRSGVRKSIVGWVVGPRWR